MDKSPESDYEGIYVKTLASLWQLAFSLVFLFVKQTEAKKFTPVCIGRLNRMKRL